MGLFNTTKQEDQNKAGVDYQILQVLRAILDLQKSEYDSKYGGGAADKVTQRRGV